MPLVPTAELLTRSAARGRGLGALNVITLEHAEAVLAGAEQADRAVVLQLSQNAVRFHHCRPHPLTAALRVLAEAAVVDVALHLDHVDDPTLLHQAAEAGFSSVMFDAGARPYEDNLAATARAVVWGHDHGLLVEAELGFVGGKADQVASAHQAGVRTDPQQAAAFVTDTGVDALAVAVGSSHAMTTRTAELDLDLVTRLATAVPVPLVLHGSSGVPDATLAAAVAAGLTKINIGTITATTFTRAIRDYLGEHPETDDPRHHLAPARDAVAALVARLLGVISP